MSSTFTSLAGFQSPYKIAKPHWRLVAMVVDALATLAIQLTIFLPFSLYFSLTRPTELQLLPVQLWLFAVFLLVGLLVTLVYHTIFEILWRGQTPGKRMTELRVVHSNGQILTFQGALLRNIVRIIDVLPFGYFVGGLTYVLNGQYARLGDLAADTRVVTEDDGFIVQSSVKRHRNPISLTRRLPLPPITPETAKLPLGKIHPDTLVLAEAYLRRRHELTNPQLVARRVLSGMFNDMQRSTPTRLNPKEAEKLLSEVLHAAVVYQRQGTISITPPQSTRLQP